MTSKRKGNARRAKDHKTKRKPRHARLSARKRSRMLLRDLRNNKAPYTTLLHEYRLDTRTAHKYLAAELKTDPGSRRVYANKARRPVLVLMFPTRLGDVPIRTRSPRNATTLSQFFNDRSKLLRGKLSADEFKAKWQGKRVAGQEVLADPSEIFAMANAGLLKLDTLYANTAPER